MNNPNFARRLKGGDQKKNNNKAPEKLDGKRARGVIKRLGGYILKYWPLFLVAIILTLASNQLSLLGPKFSGDAIDALSETGGVNFTAVKANIIKMIICYVAAAILSYLLAVLMIKISQKIVYTMRKQVFEKLTTLPISYFDTHTTGDIISRMSYDIDTVNASLSHDLVQVMTSLYMVIGSLAFMWQISKPLIIVFIFTVPASILFTRYRSKRVKPLFRKRSQKLGELNGYAEEMLTGNMTIRAYHREEDIGRTFGVQNEDAMESYYNADYYGATLGPSVNFINNFSLSLIMIFGGILYMYSQNGAVVKGSIFFITLGGIAQFVQYSRKFAGPINQFANILNEFQSAFAAAERVFRIIDEEPEKADVLGAVDLEEIVGNVEFENVKFGYTPNKTILHDLSVHAQAGKTLAIVGPTGAGKTTIINLLMRFYDVDSGNIYVDGKENRDLRRSSLRKAYTMVLQDTWLFHGTIYDNIVYGKEDATREEVIEVAKAAKIDTFIEHLPDGYDTILSDDGLNISKGQRQLITIARAMLSQAPMLILDEATSNVDSRTEIKTQQAMTELMKDRTSFVIAHRLSTIKNADRILVLRDGRVTEQGNHNELLEMKGFYCKLYNSQFD